MPVTNHNIGSLPELVEKTLELTKEQPPVQSLWFRGHGCSSYKLLPGLMRQGKGPEEVLERERRLLVRFRQRSLPYWAAGYPQNDWEHLFSMQHYGVPTRLLDWSENLMFAAYFAAAGQKACDCTSCDPVVWVLDPIGWNRSMPALSEFGESVRVLTTTDEEAESYKPDTTRKRHKSPVAIHGTHNSPRIVTQRGTFVAWGADVRGMEEVAAEPTCSAQLHQVTLSGCRDSIREALGFIGLRRTMVYPDLQALASELNHDEGWLK